ncbi:MAG: YbaY family lipoprotein [Symbiopectobacterium sp.]
MSRHQQQQRSPILRPLHKSTLSCLRSAVPLICIRVPHCRNTALTVTVSDASVVGCAITRAGVKVAWTDRKQAPFILSLLYRINPADVQPNARILLSTAVTIDNRVVIETQDTPAVITNCVTRADLLLIPVESVALPMHSQGGLLTHSAHIPFKY